METRMERAERLHKLGYNCAQSVVCAYCDAFDLDEETAFKMAEGFGSGMGLFEVCGALTGAFMLAGVKGSKGTAHPGETKGRTYQATRALGKAFQEKNGSYLCHELKGMTDGVVRRTCPGCIEDACRLIEEQLLENK